MRRDTLIVLTVGGLALAAIGALWLFAGSGQQGPDASPSAASALPPAEDSPASRAAPQPEAPQPPSESKAPLAIDIPGCKCHSKDPKLVKQHKKYRIDQCFSCHKSGSLKMGG